jgi:hypothetical protein
MHLLRQTAPPQARTMPAATEVGMNKTSSLCVLATCALTSVAGAADLTLYTDGDFQGRPLNVVIDLKQLGSLNFNDRASSVVIEKGAWILCSDEEFTGRCVTLEPGRYGSLRDLGLDDSVTSVRRRDQVSPGVFSDAQPGEREN